MASMTEGMERLATGIGEDIYATLDGVYTLRSGNTFLSPSLALVLRRGLSSGSHCFPKTKPLKVIILEQQQQKQKEDLFPIQPFYVSSPIEVKESLVRIIFTKSKDNIFTPLDTVNL